MWCFVFNAFEPKILFQEVPDEVSLGFLIAGCPLKCNGCHSQFSWPINSGFALSNTLFESYLLKYTNLITCITFFGGEWNANALIEKLIIVKKKRLKTCLYSGHEKVSKKLTEHLDFIKLGAWQPALGGLESATTNQRFIDLSTGQCLNQKFQQ